MTTSLYRRHGEQKALDIHKIAPHFVCTGQSNLIEESYTASEA